jgi:hypothetical protein
MPARQPGRAAACEETAQGSKGQEERQLLIQQTQAGKIRQVSNHAKECCVNDDTAAQAK